MNSVSKVHILAIAIPLFSWIAASPAAGASYKLVAVDYLSNASPTSLGPSRLYDIDANTGTALNPRETGITGLLGISTHPGTGELFGLTGNIASPWTNSLVKLDVPTGEATLVGGTGLSALGEGDLVFQPATGHLFGMQLVPAQFPAMVDINPLTGAATVVGPIGDVSGDHSAAAFDSSGTMYAIFNPSNNVKTSLQTIDPSNGAVLTTIPLSFESGALAFLGNSAGMAFDPTTGDAYVAGGNNGPKSLYKLNTMTGVLTLIGPLGIPQLSGLAFVLVPEPSSYVLAVCGVALCLAHWRRLLSPPS